MVNDGDINKPDKIVNGSKITIGRNRSVAVMIDQHFNWFQKKMFRFCFVFTVEDYSED